MSSFKGITDATKDILEKKKVEKIKFGDIAPPVLEAAREDILTIKTLKQGNIKHVKDKNIKNVKSQNDKTLERRKASKNQITAYLLDNELEMLEELYFIRRKQRIKTDKSSLIGEAIELLHKKSV